jgi:hypothetical protein
MENKAFLPILVLALISIMTLQEMYSGNTVSFASTRFVNRDISLDTIAPGSQVSITLNVGVLAGDSFYLIDEALPEGWTIADNGGMNQDEPGHLKIALVEPSGVSDTTYTYVATAPLVVGIYMFSGTYQIEGMPAFQSTGGETGISVQLGATNQVITPVTGPSGGSTVTEECSLEGGQEACGSDTGECTIGERTCTSGTWTACIGSVSPSEEVCDLKDNDCDGQVDEGLNCTCLIGETRPCGSDVGACSAGIRYCMGGEWRDCVGTIGPTIEICDLKDNDCDGQVDESCVTAQNATIHNGKCADGDIPEMGCFCGVMFHTRGYCLNGVLMGREPSQFPLLFIISAGLTALIVTLFGSAFLYLTREKGENA